MARFAPRSDADIIALIADYPLAWIVSAGSTCRVTSSLPLLAETDADGKLVTLFGHFARANPHVAALEASPMASAMFSGPQGYVSPRLVSKTAWAPTWNFATVRCDGRVAFVPEKNDAALARLAEHLERGTPSPWTVSEMGERYERLKPGIIAFRMEVEAVDARFKLGQDEAPEHFEEITASHPNRALAEWMRRTVRG